MYRSGHTTFCDQARAAWDAHIVVLTHGAEEGNLLFMRPGAWGAVELSLTAGVPEEGNGTMDELDAPAHLTSRIFSLLERRLVCLNTVSAATVRSLNASMRCIDAFRDAGCRLRLNESLFERALIHYADEIRRTSGARRRLVHEATSRTSR